MRSSRYSAGLGLGFRQRYLPANGQDLGSPRLTNTKEEGGVGGAGKKETLIRQCYFLSLGTQMFKKEKSECQKPQHSTNS